MNCNQFIQSRLVLLLAILCMSLPAQDNFTLQEKEIRELIRQLGDRDFQKRKAAEQELIEKGEAALQFLSESRETEDPEIAFRVSSLISKILDNSKSSYSSGMKFALIEVGEFTMGSPPKESGRLPGETPHQVEITKYFMLGTHEVTQREFAKVMHFQPSYYSPTGEGKTKINKLNTDQFPVDSVTWFDALVFCNKLSKRDNLPEHYTLTDIEKIGKTIVKAKVTLKGGPGYRLPTEAEWEYACRAGSSTPYHFGTRGKGGNYQHIVSTGYGRSRSSSLGRTTKVGSYKPNAWGLYDMHGNVSEWCWDWYSQSYYERSPKIDPMGPKSGVLSYKVLRGGSFLVNQMSCRSASRFYTVPKAKNYYAGFRIAKDLSKHVNDAMKAQQATK